MPTNQCRNTDVPGACSNEFNRSTSVTLNSRSEQISSQTPQTSGKTHISKTTSKATLKSTIDNKYYDVNKLLIRFNNLIATLITI